MGVNRRTIPGIGTVDVWDNLDDIPYNYLAPGGTFYCENVPADMNEVGFGMGATPEGTTQILYPGQVPDPNTPWIITILVAHSGLIIGMIVVAVSCIAISHLIYTIKAVPQGEITHEFPDGSVLFQAGDGSSWRLYDDGTSEQLSGPPVDIAQIGTVVIVLIIVGVVAYLIITAGPKLIPKSKKKAEPEPS